MGDAQKYKQQQQQLQQIPSPLLSSKQNHFDFAAHSLNEDDHVDLVQEHTSFQNDLTQSQSFILHQPAKKLRSKSNKVKIQVFKQTQIEISPIKTPNAGTIGGGIQGLLMNYNGQLQTEMNRYMNEQESNQNVLSPLFRKKKKKQIEIGSPRSSNQKNPTHISKNQVAILQQQSGFLFFTKYFTDLFFQSGDFSSIIDDISSAQLKDVLQSQPSFKRKRSLTQSTFKTRQQRHQKHLQLLINKKSNSDNNQFGQERLNEEVIDKSLISSASPFFKSNNKKRVKKRKDQFGVRIVKGQKNHKISFIDDVMDYKLAEINIVESYKEYYRYDNNRETEVACKFCSIY
eukprot:403350511